jgi:hypothetical protein
MMTFLRRIKLEFGVIDYLRLTWGRKGHVDPLATLDTSRQGESGFLSSTGQTVWDFHSQHLSFTRVFTNLHQKRSTAVAALCVYALHGHIRGSRRRRRSLWSTSSVSIRHTGWRTLDLWWTLDLFTVVLFFEQGCVHLPRFNLVEKEKKVMP